MNSPASTKGLQSTQWRCIVDLYCSDTVQQDPLFVNVHYHFWMKQYCILYDVNDRLICNDCTLTLCTAAQPCWLYTGCYPRISTNKCKHLFTPVYLKFCLCCQILVIYIENHMGYCQKISRVPGKILVVLGGYWVINLLLSFVCA